jgi:hypothetical protein
MRRRTQHQLRGQRPALALVRDAVRVAIVTRPVGNVTDVLFVISVAIRSDDSSARAADARPRPVTRIRLVGTR